MTRDRSSGSAWRPEHDDGRASPDASFEDARHGMLLAAEGWGQHAVRQVCNAWAAVGVGAPCAARRRRQAVRELVAQSDIRLAWAPQGAELSLSATRSQAGLGGPRAARRAFSRGAASRVGPLDLAAAVRAERTGGRDSRPQLGFRVEAGA